MDSKAAAEAIREAFRTVDHVNIVEIRELLRSLGVMTDEEIDEFIGDVDIASDGQVDIESFIARLGG